MTQHSRSFGGTRPFVRRDSNGPLRVLVLGRVSTEHQDLENIEASYADVERQLRTMHDGPTDIKHLGERGSGWKLDRGTILEAEEEIQAKKYDLIIMEDLGRAYRNPAYQFRLAHMCLDSGTRLICLADGIDTADPDWEPRLHTAVLLHGMAVPQTRRRVRRTATHTFHNGGMVLKIRFGYRRLTLEEAHSGQFGPKGLRLAKRCELTPIIREMRERVLRDEPYAAIAVWLNAAGIEPGEYATRGIWTSQLVSDLLRDPILHGLRTFRDQLYELVYSTGEHRRDANPNPDMEYVAELAHMSEEEQKQLWTAMDEHAPPRGPHPRRGTARKQSYWPGQHLCCGICGAEFHWCGRPKLKCKNCLPGGTRSCWNHVQVNAEQVRTKLLPALLARLRSNAVLFDALIDSAWTEFERESSRSTREVEAFENRRQELLKDRERITNLLVRHSDSDALHQGLDATEGELKAVQVEIERKKVELQTQATYLTRDELAGSIEEAVLQLSRTSFPFSALLRHTFPNLVVVPVQAVDTGQVHPRIKLELPSLKEGEPSQTIIVDAFDPPKQLRFAAECQRLKDQYPKMRLIDIGAALGISKKNAHDALRVARLMHQRAVETPYIELTSEPETASRWRQIASAVPDAVQQQKGEGFEERSLVKPVNTASEKSVAPPELDRSSTDPSGRSCS